jgi:hypothetical protein
VGTSGLIGTGMGVLEANLRIGCAPCDLPPPSTLQVDTAHSVPPPSTLEVLYSSPKRPLCIRKQGVSYVTGCTFSCKAPGLVSVLMVDTGASGYYCDTVPLRADGTCAGACKECRCDDRNQCKVSAALLGSSTYWIPLMPLFCLEGGKHRGPGCHHEAKAGGALLGPVRRRRRGSDTALRRLRTPRGPPKAFLLARHKPADAPLWDRVPSSPATQTTTLPAGARGGARKGGS